MKTKSICFDLGSSGTKFFLYRDVYSYNTIKEEARGKERYKYSKYIDSENFLTSNGLEGAYEALDNIISYHNISCGHTHKCTGSATSWARTGIVA